MVLKKYLSSILTLIFLSLFIWYGLTNPEVFEALSQLSILSIALLLFAKIVMSTMTGLFTKWTAEVFGRKLTMGESLYLVILSSMGNFFGPLLGGAGIRAVYLKKVHGLTYSKFTSTMFGYYLILYVFTVSAGIIALLLLPYSSQTSVLLAFFFLWLITMILLMSIKLPREKINNVANNKVLRAISEALYSAEEGWRLIASKKNLILKLILIVIVSYLSIFFMSFVEFTLIESNIIIPALMLYTTFIFISMLFSITPGAIGIRESMLLVLSLSLSVSNEQILQVAVIDRAITFLYLGILFVFTRSRKLRRTLTLRNDTV